MVPGLFEYEVAFMHGKRCSAKSVTGASKSYSVNSPKYRLQKRNFDKVIKTLTLYARRHNIKHASHSFFGYKQPDLLVTEPRIHSKAVAMVLDRDDDC